MLKNIIYALTCLSFSIVIGGAVYEHIGVVPQWSAGPPASLAMFQGPYGLKAEAFWMAIHPVTLLLFILTLVLNWKTNRRKPVLIAFSSYALILVITAIFFVPELLAITQTPYSNEIDPSLTDRANLWETLSLIRLGVLFILAINLFLGMSYATAVQPGIQSERLVRKNEPVPVSN